jgi:hypothetical protein
MVRRHYGVMLLVLDQYAKHVLTCVCIQPLEIMEKRCWHAKLPRNI